MKAAICAWLRCSRDIVGISLRPSSWQAKIRPIHRSRRRRAPAAAQRAMRSSGCGSRGQAFVATMQATDLRDSNHLFNPGWLYRACVGAILVEGKICAGSLVVVDVRRQGAAQMALVEDDNMSQKLTANFEPMTRST